MTLAQRFIDGMFRGSPDFTVTVVGHCNEGGQAIVLIRGPHDAQGTRYVVDGDTWTREPSHPRDGAPKQ